MPSNYKILKKKHYWIKIQNIHWKNTFCSLMTASRTSESDPWCEAAHDTEQRLNLHRPAETQRCCSAHAACISEHEWRLRTQEQANLLSHIELSRGATADGCQCFLKIRVWCGRLGVTNKHWIESESQRHGGRRSCLHTPGPVWFANSGSRGWMRN